MTSIVRAPLDGVTVLRLTAGSTCSCGVQLAEGARVGYEVASSTVRCAGCTAGLGRAERAALSLRAELEGPMILEGTTWSTPSPVLDQVQLRARCVQIVADRRGLTQAREEARRGAVSGLLARLVGAHRGRPVLAAPTGLGTA